MREPWSVLSGRREDLDLERLEGYAAELERWNRAIRLVGPRDLAGIRLQIEDALLPFLLEPLEFPLLDIGSGAGLPGIPLAVAFPGERVVCLEPQAKRVSFLRHVVRHLGLASVEVVGQRAEEATLRGSELRGGFRTVTARAVSDVGALLELCAPFLAEGGKVVLPRGGAPLPAARGWVLIYDRAYEGPQGVGPRRVGAYRRDANCLA